MEENNSMENLTCATVSNTAEFISDKGLTIVPNMETNIQPNIEPKMESGFMETTEEKGVNEINNKKKSKKVRMILLVILMVIAYYLYSKFALNDFEKMLVKFENTLNSSTYTSEYISTGTSTGMKEQFGSTNDIATVDGERVFASYDRWTKLDDETETSTLDAKEGMYEKGGFNTRNYDQNKYKEYLSVVSDIHFFDGSTYVENYFDDSYLEYLINEDGMPIRYRLDMLTSAIEAYLNDETDVIATYEVSKTDIKIEFNQIDLYKWAKDNYTKYVISDAFIEASDDLAKNDKKSCDTSYTIKFDKDYVTEMKINIGYSEYIYKFSDFNAENNDIIEATRDFDAYWQEIYEELDSK